MKQEDKILIALKRAENGLHPTYFIQDLHIYQYNARIKGLRDTFGCICKHSNKICPADEHIINKRLPNGTTKFFYKKTTNKLAWIKDARRPVEKKSEPEQSLFDGI